MNDYQKLKHSGYSGGHYHERTFAEKFGTVQEGLQLIGAVVAVIAFDFIKYIPIWILYGWIAPALNLPVVSFWTLWLAVAVIKAYFGGFSSRKCGCDK